ncbi:DUF2442 domain-containing protein [Halochromatium glycolicum]|jgi:hypothetical protein|uniref:DUF2442 domain-containing protein n=1 Tax=Halochromatium glycolicum TaxID=85075 RepID=A0AAJ0XD21_9GAMM|nr:DUF2442 domain-containing protein [Halochromatium glycolicum]MBK1707332.1 hypothetical protein [Halochromatium glycolicum]
MIEVTAVQAVPDFRLVLTFNTGERRRFDMRPYLHYPVFRRLENPAFFDLARVDYGTVTWPGEIDIAPETLYEHAIPIETALSLAPAAGEQPTEAPCRGVGR